MRRRLARTICTRTALASLAALGTIAVPAIARAQATPPDPATKGQVMAVVKRMFDGMRAADSSMVHSTFHEQLRMVTVAKGRDGQLRFTAESTPDGFLKAVGTPRPAMLDERIFNERVEIDGPLASVWVDYNLYLGDKFMHCGIDHFLLTRGDDGAWKIFSLADTRRTEGCKP